MRIWTSSTKLDRVVTNWKEAKVIEKGTLLNERCPSCRLSNVPRRGSKVGRGLSQSKMMLVMTVLWNLLLKWSSTWRSISIKENRSKRIMEN